VVVRGRPKKARSGLTLCQDCKTLPGPNIWWLASIFNFAYKHQKISFPRLGVTYVGCSNVLPRSTNPARLDSTRSVDTKIPGMLYVVLNLENSWNSFIEVLMPLRFNAKDIRSQHLDIAVSTKAT
jgi:hypothetical protein